MLRLVNNERVSARSVVIASGARYRRLDVANLDRFEGSGVHYWASPLEGKALRRAGGGARRRRQFGGPSRCLSGEPRRQGLASRARAGSRGEHVALPRRPHRGPAQRGGCDAGPGQRLEGRDGMLEAIRWRSGSGEEMRRPIRHLFLFIGAEPNTEWLAGSGVALDAKGFVMTGETPPTGPRTAGDEPARRLCDRRRSLRLCKARSRGVGEGAQVVAALHAFLSLRRTELAPAAGLHERSH